MAFSTVMGIIEHRNASESCASSSCMWRFTGVRRRVPSLAVMMINACCIFLHGTVSALHDHEVSIMRGFMPSMILQRPDFSSQKRSRLNFDLIYCYTEHQLKIVSYMHEPIRAIRVFLLSFLAKLSSCQARCGTVLLNGRTSLA